MEQRHLQGESQRPIDISSISNVNAWPANRWLVSMAMLPDAGGLTMILSGDYSRERARNEGADSQFGGEQA